MNMKWIFWYLLIVNIVTFLVFAIDKWKAKNKKWRIRELVLLTFSAIGGVVGGLMSMYAFRHKTQTAIFKFGMPIILILHIVLAIFLYSKGII